MLYCPGNLIKRLVRGSREEEIQARVHSLHMSELNGRLLPPVSHLWGSETSSDSCKIDLII
jgi:hypothetical protein